MKTKIFTFFLALAASVWTVFAQSGTCGANLTWELTNGVLTISGTGEMNNHVCNIPNVNVADFQSSSPFWFFRESITSVVINPGVTSIGDAAFAGCTGLTSVEISNSVISIGHFAFCRCTGLTSVTIGNSVTSIGEKAFYECTGLTSVEIPYSVTSIGLETFCGCTGLTSIDIPNSVTDIETSAFESCTGLTDIYVTCGDLDRVRQMLGNDSRVKYPPLPYSVSANAENGSVSFPQTICDALELAAIPDYGYHFTQWSDGNTENPRTFVLTQDTTFTAEFAKNTYTITAESNNPEWGSASGKTALYKDEIEISATANYGYHFVEWNDGNTQNPRKVTVKKDKTYTATFAKNIYSITKNAEHGYIYGSSSAEYLDEVTMTVNADYGYHFTQWSDGNTDNPRTFVLTQDTTFTAEFAHNPVITYVCNPQMGQITGPTMTSTGMAEENITFEAIPYYGYHFVQWNDGNTENPRTIVLTQDTTITAEFEKNTYTITTESENQEWGTANGGKSALYLDNVEISATANYGYHFARWDDGNTQNPRTVTATEDKTYTATFAKNTYNITKNAEQGTISGPSQAQYLDTVTLTANPNYGYHFTQWSDGNTENPRTVVLTQDTTFTAEFAVDKNGTCGDNLALRWEYDDNSKSLTISGNGTLNCNYTFGVEAPTSVEKLVIAEGVTSIGNSAFAEYSTLKHLSVAASVKTIHEQAFYNCTGLEEIYCYRATPPTAYSNTFDGIEKFECVLHVLSASVNMYKSATGWRDFYYVQTIDAVEVTELVTDVTVVPTDNTAEVTWPAVEQTATYTLVISKDGVVFCTLIFNANGQLQGIAFAPSRNDHHHAPAAVKTSNGGLRFTVTGLDSGTNYHLTLNAKDSDDQVIASYTSNFTTSGVARGIEDVKQNVQATKFLHNSQILILRGDRTYTVTGQEIK